MEASDMHLISSSFIQVNKDNDHTINCKTTKDILQDLSFCFRVLFPEEHFKTTTTKLQKKSFYFVQTNCSDRSTLKLLAINS